MSTPTTILACEAAILDRLVARCPGVAIESFPDKPDAYKLTHQRGAYLVAFRGSSYDDGDSEALAFERTMRWDCVIVCRQLSGSGGAYELLEGSRRALLGWSPPGFSRFAPVDERFLIRGDGTWIYAQTFATKTLAVYDDALDADTPALTRSTATGLFGDTAVAP